MAWKLKGNWYETCASQGQCAHYFGRDREDPCKSFQLFEITEGEIDGVDVSGILVMTCADLFSSTFAGLMGEGGEGGVYISDKTTEEGRYWSRSSLTTYQAGSSRERSLGSGSFPLA